VTLTAVGDLMFYGTIREAAIAAGDLRRSLRPVEVALRRGDVLFGNLELPVSIAQRAQPGCSRERCSPPGIGRALRDAGFDVVNVANNHIYDFGAEGVESTLRDLADGGPAAVGMGRSAAEARRPVVVQASSGARIGFLAYATAHMAVDAAHEYVACFPHVPTVVVDVTALRRSVDAVVVSCHTGAQYNPYPAPETRQLARAAIGAGAAVFLGHHPHVPQGWERIGEGVAFYSLGNFVAPSRRPETRRTFFARVVLDGARVCFHEVVPCYIEDDGRTVVAEGLRARDIGDEVDRLSDEIADGHSDDRHYMVARSRAWSQYAATWWREFRRGGPRAILRKIRHFRLYHATLVSRMILGGSRGRRKS
jgi:poly-gamma-glutamate synthesis protein (capsule biosynthesis protein)